MSRRVVPAFMAWLGLVMLATVVAHMCDDLFVDRSRYVLLELSPGDSVAVETPVGRLKVTLTESTGVTP